MASSSPADSLTQVSPNNGFPTETKYRVYRRRWLMLAVYCGLNAANGMLWYTFAPASTVAAEYYGVSITAINWLAQIYMLLYIPFFVPAAWLLDVGGLRVGLGLGAVLNIISVWVRCISLFPVSTGAKYAFLLIGQMLGSIGQPLILATSTKLAATWFADQQRATANTIGTVSNPLGIAVASVLTPALVSKPIASEFTVLNLVYAGIVTAMSFLAIFMQAEPPCAPSATAPRRKSAQMNGISHPDSLSKNDEGSGCMPVETTKNVVESRDPEIPENTGKDKPKNVEVSDNSVDSFGHDLKLLSRGSMQEYMGHLHVLSRNYGFIIVFFVFGLGLGLFNTLTTLLQQIIEPNGYSVDDAGLLGALIIVGGLLGAGLTGFVLDKTRRYREVMTVVIAGCTISFVWFAVEANKPGRLISLCLCCGVLGAFAFGVMPVCFELSAECSYPIPEAATSGLLCMLGQVFGIIFISLCDGPLVRGSNNDMSLSTYLMAGVAAFTTILTLVWRGRYLKLEAENAAKRVKT